MEKELDTRTNSKRFRDARNERILSLYDERLCEVTGGGVSPTSLMQAIADKMGMSMQGVRWVLMRNGRPVTAGQARKEAE